ncbi:MAG: InlB B-repeat-containing protein, partial [Bacteroidales bacterium]|nr:InlB B-repeat-containing protein [Bacteroidales bacterium]
IVELETPYTIRDGVNFWISVVANGNTLFVYNMEASGDVIEAGSFNNSMAIARADMNYLSTVSSNGNDYLKSNYSAVYTDNTRTYIQTYSNEFALSYYVSDGDTPYVESSDIDAWLLDDDVSPYHDAAPTMTIDATDNIVLYPVFHNQGPETATGTITTAIKIGSETIDEESFNVALGKNYFTWIYGSAHSYTITAETLNQMVITGTFDVCLHVNYSGFDPDLSNNVSCITVTRATPTFTISASANPVAGGSVTGAGTYDLGEGVNLVATPAAGYRFTNWTENGTVVSTNANYQFTASADRTLVANFTQRTYNVTATVDPDNGGTISGNNSPYTYGTNVSLTAIANPGFAFVNWTDEDANVVSTNTTYQFAIDGNRTFVAHFEAEQYEITATANPTEGGSVTGTGTFNYGQQVSLSATPNEGYQFVNWTENGSTVYTNANYSFTATTSRTLVANFQINTYTISASVNPVAGGTVNGAGNYTHGQTVTLTATANVGYNFVNWTENGSAVSTDAEYSFTANADRTLVANFEVITYTITANAYPVAGGTVSGADTYTYGSSCTLTASANTGYQFVNWTGSDGSVVSSNASYSFTVTSDNTYQANFTKTTVTSLPWTENFDNGYSCVEYAWVYLHGEWATPLRYEKAPNVTNYYWGAYSDPYCIELRANNCSNLVVLPQFGEPLNKLKVSFRLGRGNASTGYTVQLGYVTNPSDASTFVALNNIATPSSGLAHFDLYTYDLTQDNNSPSSSEYRLAIKYTMSGEDSWYLDNFDVRVPSYTISASANPTEGGNITGAGTYNHGETCTLTAVAEEGYHFVDWTENGSSVSTDAEYSFTATANRTLVANFQINSYTISASANPVAGGTVSGAGEYTHGQSVTLNATANTGYNFVNWTENDTEVSTNAEYSFNATADRTLVANFEAITYTISASASPAEGGTVNGTGDYTYGQNVTLNAVANTGYTFVNWTENGTEVST